MPRFQATFRGRDLWAIQPPRSGLAFAPVLEWELARQWNGISPAEWHTMDGYEQSRYVAVYRAKHHMDAVIAYHQAEEAKRNSRAGRSKYGKR